MVWKQQVAASSCHTENQSQRREPGGSTGGGDQKEHGGKETNSGTGENARQGVGAGEA